MVPLLFMFALILHEPLQLIFSVFVRVCGVFNSSQSFWSSYLRCFLFCCFFRWAIVYIAQMKPLIVPILSEGEWSALEKHIFLHWLGAFWIMDHLLRTTNFTSNGLFLGIVCNVGVWTLSLLGIVCLPYVLLSVV